MTPRYLYGDSEDFPGGSDFLTELRQFVAAASRVLALSHEADELERTLGTKAQEHVGAVESLQGFFDGITDMITERAARSGSPQIVGPYASQLLEQVEAVATQARLSRTHDLDAAQIEVASRIRECRAQLKVAISAYLLGDPLPAASWALSLALAGNAQPHGEVVLDHPDGLTTSWAIDVASDSSWGRAKRVEDVAAGLTLQVGFKKAFLRSALQPDIMPLDELVIAAIELGPDSMELRLRRRADAPRDDVTIALDPDEHGNLQARVLRANGEGADAPFQSPADERQRIEQLAQTLRRECWPLIQKKKRLLSALLDGQDIFEQGRVNALLERIVERMAPIATEVARHSPNPNELSLKLERDDGRREELYLRKADLRQLVASLPSNAQILFHRLAFLTDRPPSHHPPSHSPSVPPPPKRPL